MWLVQKVAFWESWEKGSLVYCACRLRKAGGTDSITESQVSSPPTSSKSWMRREKTESPTTQPLMRPVSTARSHTCQVVGKTQEFWNSMFGLSGMIPKQTQRAFTAADYSPLVFLTLSLSVILKGDPTPNIEGHWIEQCLSFIQTCILYLLQGYYSLISYVLLPLWP